VTPRGPVPLDPPPVTIVDPHAAPFAEVLGEDRDPWRPSRNQRLLLTVVLLLAGLVAGGITWRRHTAHERALDRAAVTGVKLTAQLATDEWDPSLGTFPLQVENDGTLPLRLQSAQLLLTGFAEQRLRNVRLVRAADVTVRVPDTAPCGPALMQNVLTGSLRVSVLTSRGARVTRDLPLTSLDILAIRSRAQERCGYVEPGRALDTEVVGVRPAGGDALVTIRVRNGSALPLRLQRLSAFPGLSLTVMPRLPFVLPPEPPTSSRRPYLTLQVLVRLSDCRLMRRTSALLAHEQQNPAGFSFSLATKLTATVSDLQERAVGSIDIFTLPGVSDGELPAPLARLVRCAATP
jgi:hypothetical protein